MSQEFGALSFFAVSLYSTVDVGIKIVEAPGVQPMPHSGWICTPPSRVVRWEQKSCREICESESVSHIEQDPG